MTPPGTGDIIIGDRRKRPPVTKEFWLGVAGALISGLLFWAFTTAAGGGIVTGSRFVTDSVRRDNDKAALESTLNRIDSRVGTIYCASLPKDKQPGCR